MQEPTRFNLLGVLQKSLKWAQKKIYIHRIIYIAKYTQNASLNIENRFFNIMIDSNIKLVNEEYCEDIITGFGLFYSGYFINIVEGPEETLIKHLKSLVNSFEQKLTKIPEVTKMKILLVSHHINVRYYTTWSGRFATPPVLLDRMEQTPDAEENFRHIKNCILKLYRMSEYLRNQPPNILRTVMDNISDLCRANLPEVNLLEFLLHSPCLKDVKKFLQIYGAVPEYSPYYEYIWPVTCNFVPTHILKDETSKKLMRMEVPSKGKETAEEEEVPETS